jgi:hypothetical protein
LCAACLVQDGPRSLGGTIPMAPPLDYASLTCHDLHREPRTWDSGYLRRIDRQCELLSLHLHAYSRRAARLGAHKLKTRPINFKYLVSGTMLFGFRRDRRPFEVSKSNHLRVVPSGGCLRGTRCQPLIRLQRHVGCQPRERLCHSRRTKVRFWTSRCREYWRVMVCKGILRYDVC